MTGTLERMAENARLEAMRQRALEVQGQPAPAEPTGGVSVSPEAVADLRDTRLPAAARGVVDGWTFGFGDTLAGIGGAIDPNNTYQTARDEWRLATAMDERDAGGSRLAGQILGGAGIGMATAGPVDDFLRTIPGLRGSGTLARMGRNTIAGMGEGALFGAGEADNQDVLPSAMTGAAAGGIVGAAVTPTAELLRRMILRPAGGALNIGNQSRAGNAVIRALEEAGMTPQQIDDALRVAAADGQDIFSVADVLGHTGRRSLAGVASQPGAARSLAEEALTGRQADQTTRLAQFVEEAMDARNTRAQEAAAARVARGAAGNVNYAAARANAAPVDVRGVLDVIDSQIGPMRNTTIQGEGVDATLDGIRRRLAGTLTEGEEVMPAELADLPRLVRLYGEIGDDIQAARRAGRGFEASQLADVQAALGKALEDASPDWRTANANFAGASRVVESPDAGQAANRPTARAADVADEWSAIEARINRIDGLTPEERAQYIEDARQAYRTGYANRDLAMIEGARDTRNMAGQLFNNTRQRENYGLMADDADLFFRRVGREDTMSETRNAVLGGSRTAELLSDQAAANGEDVSILANLLSGRPGAAVGQVAGRAYQAAQGTNEATRELIARALLSRNPGELERLLRPAQRNEAVSRVISGLIRGTGRAPGYEAGMAVAR